MPEAPMSKKIENQLYLRASNGFDRLRLAERAFSEFLQESGQEAMSKYYRARNYLRDAESEYGEAFKEAKRLVGPLPAYSAPEFEKWRRDFLSHYRILAESEEMSALKQEILNDGLVDQYLSPEDLDRLLAKNFEAQRSGKRKLANIKVRIILDRLSELMSDVQRLAKQAREKFQAGG
jgi:hypothetical protein